MDGNNDPNKKVPDSGRTRIYKKDLDPKRIDNFSDMIKREQERMKQNQSSSSKSGQSSSMGGK
ncbi:MULTISPECIES: hypothetical protein [unclassified Wolbachia]|uniref:hypothetical protein n=1 Tax=unclassified Wolbachia TaxID=2640676 RepID=UPI002225C76E|nr:hypothetical protein [Wolbachia endosymbiont (group B) of Euphydryas aurinia]